MTDVLAELEAIITKHNDNYTYKRDILHDLRNLAMRARLEQEVSSDEGEHDRGRADQGM